MIYGWPNSGSFVDLDATVHRTAAAIAPRAAEFDSIIVRGVSGLVVGAPVALMLHKPLLVVRKPTENSHDKDVPLIGRHDAGRRCLFLDDFRSSGDTERETASVLREESDGDAWITLVYLYSSSGDWRAPLVKPPAHVLVDKPKVQPACEHERRAHKRRGTCTICWPQLTLAA